MKTIGRIKEEFSKATPEEARALCRYYQEDPRGGVQKLIAEWQKKEAALAKEQARLYAMTEYERQYEHLGALAGIDEVGRGPLAGPVVACAVILPKGCQILYINDSKKLSAKKREELAQIIQKEALAIGIGMVSPQRIDKINILQATYEAMRKALKELPIQPQLLLNDAVTIPDIDLPQIPIIKGDAKSISIAAASIVAKVTRDKLMEDYEKEYPGYGFAAHKGYGTASHIAAIKALGTTPIHRQSFIGNI